MESDRRREVTDLSVLIEIAKSLQNSEGFSTKTGANNANRKEKASSASQSERLTRILKPLLPKVQKQGHQNKLYDCECVESRWTRPQNFTLILSQRERERERERE